MEKFLDELIIGQEKKLLKIASEIVPKITSDDILQPNDFEELESHPYFRYEEGFLAGLKSVKAAILAAKIS